MTYSTVDGTVVRKSSRRGANPNALKQFVVIRMDTYPSALRIWRATMPMTLKQAAEAYRHFRRWDDVVVKMISVKEWEKMNEVTA